MLQNDYPRFGMRQMSDVDVLIDASRAGDVRQILEARGFTTESFDQDFHDVYHKLPVCSFEIHTALFSPVYTPAIRDYYGRIEEKLLPDPGWEYGRRLSDEDMYLYLLAHEHKHPRKIVFTEGPDARILEAAARLKEGGFLTPVLVGGVDEVKAAAAKGGFDIEGLEILDPLTYDKMDEMVDQMVALRKGKMTADECRALLKKGNYFGTMLVKMGVADSLLGGATYSTADTVRPALQLIKTKPGAHLVSSCFILQKDGADLLAMGDCAINISYEDKKDKDGNVTLSAAQQLAEVAIETAKTAKTFGIDPKVAMLSFSTKGI